jgi:hypothetical protein
MNKIFKNVIAASLLFLTVLIFNQNIILADTRYVSKTGTSIPPYTSWETASDSIQKCIDISSFGDTIYVANGVYKEQIIMIPGLFLIGAGLDSCVIDSRDLVTTWDATSVEVKDSCLFTGFHIYVSHNSNIGAGIVVSGNCLISHNQIRRGLFGIWSEATGQAIPVLYKNNVYDFTRSFEIFNSSALIRGNLITSASDRAINLGSWEYHKPIIDSNYITSDAFGIFMGFTSGMKIIISNNVIKLKESSAHAIFGGATDTGWVYNNLVLCENCDNSHLGINNATGYPTFNYNNFVGGNFKSGAIDAGDKNVIINNTVIGNYQGIVKNSSTSPVIKYNNSWNNVINFGGFTPDSTNISVDPMVVNPDSLLGKLDFHLQMYSPLIDAGDPSILDKNGSRSDIGLYGGPFGESYPYQDLPPRIPSNFTAVFDTTNILLSWNKNTEADFRFYKLYRDTTAGFQIDSTKLISEQTDTSFIQVPPVGIEKLFYKLTAVDNQLNESAPSDELQIILTSVKEVPVVVSNYVLYQNYPNPFNPSTKISYRLKERGYVKLYVYDITGETVAALVNETQEAGYYEVEFTGEPTVKDMSLIDRISSGIYIYRLMVRGDNNTPVFTDTKKMIYLK